MKTRFLAILGITLLGARLAVAQWSGVGAHLFPRFAIPGGVMGQSIVRINYFDSEVGDYYETSQYPTSIDIRTAKGKYVTTVRTDAQGRFRVVLRPGKYIFTPRTTRMVHTADSFGVTVQSARFHSVGVRSRTPGGGVARPTRSWSGHAVAICHKGHTIQVSSSALNAHLAHGDTIGPCEQ